MATKKHTFSDSHIQLDVIEPTNVTGNNAHISQNFWTDSNQPFSGNEGIMSGTGKYNWYGNFISCMELDWGNAKGSESDFTNMTETEISNLLFTQGIKTSDELLQVLCWLFKNRSQASDPFATISNTTITRPKNNTLSGISWTGGSVTPDSDVISGTEITFNKGTVTATYGNNNGIATITTSNISGVLTITSSNTSVVTINNVVKNGQTTITGIKAGNAIITVKDDEKVVNEFNVIVENGSNTVDVTNNTTFEDSKGSSINGTSITAPTVTSEETITITATYGGKTASTEISYTVKPETIVTYYWYVGYDQNAYETPESFKSNMYTTTTNIIPTQYSKSGDNGLDVSETGTRPNYLIMIIPSTWNKPIIYGQLKDAEITMTLEKQNVTITDISDVTFNVYSGTGEISDSKVFIN